MSKQEQAALVIIGDEVLSGKTKDANLSFIATELNNLGIMMSEARVIPDSEEVIIETINQLRSKYDYVFTTGGIGPTHDDITSASVAKAFQTELELNQEALSRIASYGNELTEARKKMAYIPCGAELLENPISFAPGFKLENVFVLAGIPKIAECMFYSALRFINKGSPILSLAKDFYMKEGDFAETLTKIATEEKNISIGSYPFSKNGKYGATIVLRGTNATALEGCLKKITDAFQSITPD